MTEVEFNDRVDTTLERIEEAFDDCEVDVDVEYAAGILTLRCPNGSAVIFSRQSATQELWVAARSGGYHLAYHEPHWRCTKTDISLSDLFADITAAQVGETIHLADL